MKEVAQRTDSLAAVSFMDLFSGSGGLWSRYKALRTWRCPLLIGTLIKDMEAAEKLEVPSLEAGRIGLCLEGVSRAKGSDPRPACFCGHHRAFLPDRPPGGCQPSVSLSAKTATAAPCGAQEGNGFSHRLCQCLQSCGRRRHRDGGTAGRNAFSQTGPGFFRALCEGDRRGGEGR